MKPWKRKLSLFLTLFILLFISLYQPSIICFGSNSTTLAVHFLDVGQADCILVQTPAGYNMLIDAGNNADAEFITSYLDSLNIKRLDIVIGTHPHEDHIGSLDTVIRRYHIGQVYMPKVTTTTKTFEDVLLAIQEKALRISTAKAGVSITLDPTVKMEFLAPNNNRYDDLNDYSAVLKLTYGNTSFLFTGDAEAISESEMLANGFSLSSDVLKVGHHGSDSSTTEAFLKKVSPKYAVISVGAGNSYGHPSPIILNRLKNYGVEILRTDLDGSIVITSDGKTIKVNKKVSPIKPNAPPSSSVQSSDQEKIKQEEPVEVTVYITKTGKKYHRAGCRYLSKSCIPVTLKVAKANGYGPCSVCRPPQ